MASQTQFDGHERKTAGTDGAASEIRDGQEAPRQRRHHPGRVRGDQRRRGQIGEGLRSRRRGPPIPNVAGAHPAAPERCTIFQSIREPNCAFQT